MQTGSQSHSSSQLHDPGPRTEDLDSDRSWTHFCAGGHLAFVILWDLYFLGVHVPVRQFNKYPLSAHCFPDTEEEWGMER